MRTDGEAEDRLTTTEEALVRNRKSHQNKEVLKVCCCGVSGWTEAGESRWRDGRMRPKDKRKEENDPRVCRPEALESSGF